MAYLILTAAGLTFLFSWYILYRMTTFVDKYVSKPEFGILPFRQSTIHNFGKIYMPTNEQFNKAFKNISNNMNSHPSSLNKIKVIVFGNTAYWVHENIFYSAEIDEFGEIKTENARPIEVDGMSEKEIDLLMSILDDLRGDENDGSSSGN